MLMSRRFFRTLPTSYFKILAKVSLPFLLQETPARRPRRCRKTLSLQCSNVTRLPMKDVADESNDIRLLSENLKTLFKLNIIESKTLDGRGGSDRSTKRSFEREAETYARSFAKCCCSASTSLNLTSTLADFLADAIVSASKRTSLDAFVDEEFARPTRFNQPEEHDGNNTSRSRLCP